MRVVKAVERLLPVSALRADELLKGEQDEQFGHAGGHGPARAPGRRLPGRQADHGGRLDHCKLIGREQVEARCEEGVDRRRERELVEVARRHPAAVLAPHEAFVDEHREQLLDEERIALGRLDDPRAHAGVEHGLTEHVGRDGGACLGLSGSSSSFVAPVSSSQPGRTSASIGRAGQTMSRGPSTTFVASEATRSSSVDSAQWRSSTTRTSGCSAASVSQSFGLPRRSRRGRTVRRKGRSRGDPPRDVGVPGAGPSFARTSAGVSSSRTPAAGEDLDQRPERDASSVGQTAAAEHARRPLGVVDELLHEPRLPHPGLAQHCDEPRRASRHDILEGAPEAGELLGPADERTPGAARGPWVGVDGEQPVGGDALRLALQLERLDLLDLDRVTYQSEGRFADEHLELRGGLLETRRDVHRVAGDESLPARRVAGDDLTSVHAGPVRQPHAPSLAELVVETAERDLHLRGGADRAKRVVLMHGRQAKDGHDRIADKFLDHAAVPLEHCAHVVEVPREHLAQRL